MNNNNNNNNSNNNNNLSNNSMATIRAPAIGIDLGTYSSSVGVFLGGKVEIILNDHGNRSTPSVVSFSDSERLVGDAAKNQMAMNPANTIYSAQRLIGRKFDDSCVQEDMKLWPFSVVGDGGKPKLAVQHKGEKKTFFPEEISAMVLTKLKETAEEYLGRTVSDAVLTVPAHFNYLQRQATRDAATIAGLNVIRMVNGSTAAAIAYGFAKRARATTSALIAGEKQNVLIFDLGAGSLDVSIVTCDGESTLRVRSTAGDSHLGGEDIDNKMVTHFAAGFKRRFKRDLTVNKCALRRLRTASVRAKETLSTFHASTLEIDSLLDDFSTCLPRSKFEQMNEELFRLILAPVEKALADAGLDKSEIDEVILVGGSCRIPKVQKLLQHFFNGKELNKSLSPEEAGAVGAAILAATIRGGGGAHHHTLHHHQVNSSNSVVGNNAIEDHNNVIRLVDVSPFSLGVETAGGVMTTVISRNTTIPTQSRYPPTTPPSQANGVQEYNPFKIKVFEGENGMTKDNNFLGEFDITSILPPPPGVPEIKVTFDLDPNAILKVYATENSTGKVASMSITSEQCRSLSSEDIQRMIRDAEAYKADERKGKERSSAKNRLEHFCFNMKSVLENDRRIALDKCNDVMRWLDDNQAAGKEEFEERQAALEMICDSIISKLEAGGGGGGSSSSGPSPSDTRALAEYSGSKRPRLC